ncbi:hypothetical protein Pcac1_g28831 [Phytophthora cactorum]|nr:hypothetical protein Pcac1_g28831 [Phytophthora cactorum]
MTSDNKRTSRQAQKASACHYCGEQGHWIAKCPARIRENAEQQRPQRANVAQSEDNFGNYLFSVWWQHGCLQVEWCVAGRLGCDAAHDVLEGVHEEIQEDLSGGRASRGRRCGRGGGDRRIVMSMKTPRGTKKGVLTSVWHIPKLSRNLFSVGRFTKDVRPATFENDGCFAETKDIKWKLGAREGKGLFKLCMTPIMPDEAMLQVRRIAKGYHFVPLASSTWSHRPWRSRCHRQEGLRCWYRYGVGEAVGAVRWVCTRQANASEPHAKVAKPRKEIVGVIHSDVCGPMLTSTFCGKRYFVTFIDEYSHFCVAYLFRNKSEWRTSLPSL